MAVGDFTDFSCSKEHLLNCSEAIANIRRLPPGFLKFPIGYTSRTSSIVVSGTAIRRPSGQFRVGNDVVYGSTKELDYELEVACIIGKPTAMGETVSLDDAEEHIFGMVLLNDWSGWYPALCMPECRLAYTLSLLTERQRETYRVLR